jgi:hypothetical protein
VSRLDVIIGSSLLLWWDKQVGTKEIVSGLCGPGLVARVFYRNGSTLFKFVVTNCWNWEFETRTRRLMV